MHGAPLQKAKPSFPSAAALCCWQRPCRRLGAFQPQRNSAHSFRQWTSCWQEVASLLILGSVTDLLCDLRQITSLLCSSSTSHLSSVLSVWLQALGGGSPLTMSMQHQPQESFNLCQDSAAQNLQLFCSPYCLHSPFAQKCCRVAKMGHCSKNRHVSTSQITQHVPWSTDLLPSRPSVFSFWLLTVHEKWDHEQGCFALKIIFECAFLRGNKHTIRRLLLLHVTLQSAEENELLWPYFLKMTINKWVRNSVITINVTKTSHIYKVQCRYTGQGKTWLVDILMRWVFIGCRCTLTTSTVPTINMSEWMSLCACVCTDRVETRDRTRLKTKAKEFSCYLHLLLPGFFKYVIPSRTIVKIP